MKLLKTEVWQSEDLTFKDRANALEGIESLIMNQLHDFVIYSQDEIEIDQFLERKISLYTGWIKMNHLDIRDDLLSLILKNENDCVIPAIIGTIKPSNYLNFILKNKLFRISKN
jgi:hypothetical protein